MSSTSPRSAVAATSPTPIHSTSGSSMLLERVEIAGDERPIAAQEKIDLPPGSRCERTERHLGARRARSARGRASRTRSRCPSSRASSAKSAPTARAFASSRRAVGSSASRSFGRAASARATATRCRSPIDRRETRCCASSSSPTAASVSRARSSSGDAAHRERELDALLRGEERHEVGALRDEADRARRRTSARAVASSCEIGVSSDVDVARRREVESGEQMEERRLARARRAGDRGEPPGCELEREVAEDRRCVAVRAS